MEDGGPSRHSPWSATGSAVAALPLPSRLLLRPARTSSVLPARASAKRSASSSEYIELRASSLRMPSENVTHADALTVRTPMSDGANARDTAPAHPTAAHPSSHWARAIGRTSPSSPCSPVASFSSAVFVWWSADRRAAQEEVIRRAGPRSRACWQEGRAARVRPLPRTSTLMVHEAWCVSTHVSTRVPRPAESSMYTTACVAWSVAPPLSIHFVTAQREAAEDQLARSRFCGGAAALAPLRRWPTRRRPPRHRGRPWPRGAGRRRA